MPRRVQTALAKSIPKKEMKAMITLRKDRNITILPSDKGKATVILDVADYKDKMQQLLLDGSYQKLR